VHGLRAELSPHRMMGEYVDYIAQPMSMEPLDCLHDSSMKGAPSIL
jgi:hypothetical protein